MPRGTPWVGGAPGTRRPPSWGVGHHPFGLGFRTLTLPSARGSRAQAMAVFGVGRHLKRIRQPGDRSCSQLGRWVARPAPGRG